LQKLFAAALLTAVSVVCILAPAKADITGVMASGPGGSVFDLGIGSVDTTDDAVQFGANYTSDGLIYFTVTLGQGDANTLYFIDPSDQLYNESSSTFPNFYAYLISGPTGAALVAAGQDEGAFGLGTSVSPTELKWSGPPGLPPGEFTFLAFKFTLPEPVVGTETVEIAFGPGSLPVPEPSTWAMMMLGFAGLGFAGFRSARARRSVIA
jgi:PEP-CTERM motif